MMMTTIKPSTTIEAHPRGNFLRGRVSATRVLTLGQRLARRATARTSDPVLPWWQATYRDSQDGNSATGVVMEASSATGATMTATE